MTDSEDVVQNYIKVNSKSNAIGFLLALFFGPLGLFYSNWIAALILCGLAISTAATIVVPIICWLSAMAITFYLVPKYNKKVEAEARLISHGRT